MISFLGVWSGLPLFLELSFKEFAENSGFSDFEIEVSKLDPWKTEVLNLTAVKERNFLKVQKIDVLYDPKSLTAGKINALSVSNLETEIYIDEDFSKEKTGENKDFFIQVYDTLEDILENPLLSYLRIRNSTFAIRDQNKSWTVDFLAKMDFLENLIHLLWDANYRTSSLLGVFNVSREGNATFASAQVKIDNAAKFFSEILSDSYLEMESLKEFTMSGGSLVLDALTQITPDGLRDVFVELNGSDFEIGLEDKNFSLLEFMVFITPRRINEWTINSYLNLKIDENFDGEEIHLKLSMEKDDLNLSGGIGYLKTQNDLPPLELIGLRFPSWELDIKNLQRIPYGQEKQFAFEELSYDGDFFKLYKGIISFLFMKDQQVNIRIPSIDAALLELGISFVQFSYFGMIDIDEIPKVDTPQIISGKMVLFGDEVLLEDLTITFRVQNQNRFLIDMLNLKIAETTLKLSPANMLIEVPENNFNNFGVKFSNSSLQFSGDEFSVDGIVGDVLFNSLEPLETNGSQTILFDSCTIGGVEIKDGNLSFEILKDGNFIINQGTANLYDGLIGFSESKFNLYGDSMVINTMIEKMNGQKIVNLVEGLDVDINGTFSGRIPFSYKTGAWDFLDGYLQLDPNSKAKLSYISNGFLTNGIKEGTEEYKRMRMTEMALEDLELDSLSLTFENEGEERQILGSIRGKSTIEKNTEITLDYRPKIIAGLKEIIHKLNLQN